VRAMHCVTCGAEMILMNVVRGDATSPPGCERHTFKCSVCHEIERRLILTRHGREIDEPPPLIPASAAQAEDIVALLRRVAAKLRGR
jgi:hypothetical protein